MIDEKDLENFNPIDMDCSVCDDDDTFVIRGGHDEVNTGDDGRQVERKTGIIIDLSDDDDCPSKKPMRVISATIDDNNNIQINKNFESDNGVDQQASNEIDMECSIGEDDDIVCEITPSKKSNALDFGDEDFYDTDLSDEEDEEAEEIAFKNKEFIDEDMIEEKKEVTQGKVEKDYWDKLQKQHQKTNVKGTYNWNFHFAGDPEKEMHMFNHDMGVEGAVPTGASAGTSAGFTGTAAAPAGGGDGGAVGGGMGESLEEDLENVFDRIGFEVIPNSDGSYIAMDKCDHNPDVEGKDIVELINNLRPYIDDCIIIPLQIETGENFNDFGEWENWYTIDNEANYPDCENDIYCCKTLARLLK